MTYPGNQQPPIMPPTTPVQPAYAPPKKGHTGLILGLVAAGLVILLGAGAVTYVLFFRTSESAQAITQCESAVQSMLKAPATAKFSGAAAAKSGAGGWDVTGSVDAENGFSALVRSSWDCYAHKNPDGTWEVRPRLDSN